tara:strand:+ start:1548 stop:1856 length:309 start_codon:yes stop_codon:yes gene_type:complete
MKKLIFLVFLLFTNLSYAEDLIKIGENIFYNKEACINCHILNAADGGNNQLSKEHVVNIVTNGYGVMPAYKDKLTEKEIEAVAIFISIEGKNWMNKLSSFVQ